MRRRYETSCPEVKPNAGSRPSRITEGVRAVAVCFNLPVFIGGPLAIRLLSLQECTSFKWRDELFAKRAEGHTSYRYHSPWGAPSLRRWF